MGTQRECCVFFVDKERKIMVTNPANPVPGPRYSEQDIMNLSFDDTLNASKGIGLTKTFDLSFTSQAAANTTAQTPVLNLGAFRSLQIFANIQGATGGTLDIYIQVSPDGGTTWVDYIHYSQLAAAAAAIQRLVTVTKGTNSGAAPVTVGINATPALAANTVVGGDFGDRLRVVAVSGAGTSAGALQTIKVTASA